MENAPTDELYVNKVIINGKAVIDLTNDTVTAASLKKGVTAHNKSGEAVVGTSTFDADTSDANAKDSEILSGVIAYGHGGVRLSGKMPNNGGNNVEITMVAGNTIPSGYYDGSGKAKISETEASKLVPGNIRKDITILGVKGTHEGEEHVTAEQRSVTPSFEKQVITPSDKSNYLSQVTVEEIPVSYSANSSGGNTCTVG